MTNAQIIFNNSIALMNDGIIKGTGELVKTTVLDGNGEEMEIIQEIPEEIHTFAAWKSRGRSVKKGEKAKAAFVIWKYSSRAVKDEAGNDTGDEESKMFMKKAFFFTFDQTEPLKAKK